MSTYRLRRRPHKRLLRSLASLLLLMAPAAVSADQSPNPAYEQMSLEELLNVDISVATKNETALSETPAMVEVILAQQIRERGYRHLGDLLNDVVTNHIDRSNYGIGEPVTQNVGFGFRFDTGQNILLLFNGQRLNSFMPGNRFAFEDYLLDNVERVELIRGPGSALYGANAFTAVINIISKTSLEEGERGYARVALGGVLPSNGGAIDASFRAGLGKKGFLSGAVRIGGEQGQSLHVVNGLFGDADLRDGIRYAIDGDVFFSYGSFRAYLKFDHQLRNTFTGFNAINPSDDNRLNLLGYAYSLGADYTHKPSEKVRLKYSVGVHLDHYSEVALIPIFQTADNGTRLVRDAQGVPILDTVPVLRDGKQILTSFPIDGETVDTVTAEAEIQVTWKYWRNNAFIAGINGIYDQVVDASRVGELQLSPPGFVPYQTFSDPANNWLSDTHAARITFGAYAQGDLALAQQLFLNAGARFDLYTGTGALSETYTAFNPRAGVVWKNKYIGSLKALFGQATRIPNGFETLSAVTILSDPAARPEQIYTFQTAWERTFEGVVSAEIGYFYSVITNHLETDAAVTEMQAAQGFIAQLRNEAGELHSQGILAKLTIKLEHLYVAANFTRYFGTSDEGPPIPYMPQTMLNVNLGVPVWWFRLNVGMNLRADFLKDARDPRPPVRDYVLVNPTLLFSPPKFPLQVRIGARNLLNYDIQYPASSLDFAQHFPGRGIEAWADVSFAKRF